MARRRAEEGGAEEMVMCFVVFIAASGSVLV
jgi:hypothetical protein